MKTIKVNFFRDKSRENDQYEAPIRLRSRHNSDKLIVKASGFSCTREKWKNGKPIDPILENQLDGLKSKIKIAYGDLTKDNRQGVTLNDVWENLNPSGNKPTHPVSGKVIDWIDHYVKTSTYSPEYVRGAKHLKVLLTGQSKKGKLKGYNPDLRLSELNQTIVNEFCAHIAKQGRATGTIVKAIKFLKQVAKIAADHKVEVGSVGFSAPKNFEKKVRTEIRLTYSELMNIREVEIDDKDENIIRDMFLFLAFTGMRHSDMVKITPANDFGDYLHFRQQKTGDEVAVTLHKFSKPLIRKYAKDKEETDTLFPSYSQQLFNKVIKTVARKAGLKDVVKVTRYSGTREIIEDLPKYKLIKTHTGRRTFSRILSTLLVPEDIIAEEMGHSGKSITRHYIGNSDHRIRIGVIQNAWSNARTALSISRAFMKVS